MEKIFKISIVVPIYVLAEDEFTADSLAYEYFDAESPFDTETHETEEITEKQYADEYNDKSSNNFLAEIQKREREEKSLAKEIQEAVKGTESTLGYDI